MLATVLLQFLLPGGVLASWLCHGPLPYQLACCCLLCSLAFFLLSTVRAQGVGSNPLLFFLCTGLRCIAVLAVSHAITCVAFQTLEGSEACSSDVSPLRPVLIPAHRARWSSIGRAPRKLCSSRLPSYVRMDVPRCSAQCREWRKCTCRTLRPTSTMSFKSAPYQPAPPPRQRRGDCTGQDRSGLTWAEFRQLHERIDKTTEPIMSPISPCEPVESESEPKGAQTA